MDDHPGPSRLKAILLTRFTSKTDWKPQHARRQFSSAFERITYCKRCKRHAKIALPASHVQLAIKLAYK